MTNGTRRRSLSEQRAEAALKELDKADELVARPRIAFGDDVVYRSMIVNVDRIRELKPAFHGEFVVILHGGTRLRCSRTYAERLTKAMGS